MLCNMYVATYVRNYVRSKYNFYHIGAVASILRNSCIAMCLICVLYKTIWEISFLSPEYYAEHAYS